MKNLKITESNHSRLAAGSGDFTITDFANAMLDHALTKFEAGNLLPKGVSMVETHHAPSESEIPANEAHTVGEEVA